MYPYFFQFSCFLRTSLFSLFWFCIHVSLASFSCEPSSCCALSALHVFDILLFLCCTFFMLSFFCVALFACCFYLSHSFHVALSSCCTRFTMRCQACIFFEQDIRIKLQSDCIFLICVWLKLVDFQKNIYYNRGVFRNLSITIFAKCSILDTWQGSQYASDNIKNQN